MTVPTTPPPLSSPDFDQLLAIKARIWSPSMIWPFSSAITTRSASPSSAMPKSARTSRTLLHMAWGAVDALGAADLGGRRQPLLQAGRHQGLDLGLHVIRQFLPVGAEEFDAIVLEGIVRGGDHHAQVGTQRPRQHGDGGGRQRAELEDIHAHGGEAGN